MIYRLYLFSFIISLFILPVISHADTNFNSRFLSNVETALDGLLSVDENLASIKNPEAYKKVSDYIEDMNNSSNSLFTYIKGEIDGAIKSAIDQINQTNNISENDFNKAIVIEYESLIKNVNDTLTEQDPTDTKKITTLEVQVDQSISIIENALESIGGINVDISIQRQNIRKALQNHQLEIRDFANLIAKTGAGGIFKDYDADGISDFDEENIYGTNPRVKSTLGDGVIDGQRVILGINPLTGLDIVYEDVRQDKDGQVLNVYAVNSLELIENNKQSILEFKGTAIPNSYVTIFIFPGEIISVIKADENGEWKYQPDREIENGVYEMYITTTDKSGKIVAKSDAVGFSKDKDTAVLGVLLYDSDSFFGDNSLMLIILIVIVTAMILGLMILGQKRYAHSLKEATDSVNKY